MDPLSEVSSSSISESGPRSPVEWTPHGRSVTEILAYILNLKCCDSKTAFENLGTILPHIDTVPYASAIVSVLPHLVVLSSSDSNLTEKLHSSLILCLSMKVFRPFKSILKYWKKWLTETKPQLLPDLTNPSSLGPLQPKTSLVYPKSRPSPGMEGALVWLHMLRLEKYWPVISHWTYEMLMMVCMDNIDWFTECVGSAPLPEEDKYKLVVSISHLRTRPELLAQLEAYITNREKVGEAIMTLRQILKTPLKSIRSTSDFLCERFLYVVYVAFNEVVRSSCHNPVLRYMFIDLLLCMLQHRSFAVVNIHEKLRDWIERVHRRNLGPIVY